MCQRTAPPASSTGNAVPATGTIRVPGSAQVSASQSSSVRRSPTRSWVRTDSAMSVEPGAGNCGEVTPTTLR